MPSIVLLFVFISRWLEWVVGNFCEKKESGQLLVAALDFDLLPINGEMAKGRP